MNTALKRALATVSLGFGLATFGASTAHADLVQDTAKQQKKQTCITSAGPEVNDGTVVTTPEGKRYRCDDGQWTGLAMVVRPGPGPGSPSPARLGAVGASTGAASASSSAGSASSSPASASSGAVAR